MEGVFIMALDQIRDSINNGARGMVDAIVDIADYFSGNDIERDCDVLKLLKRSIDDFIGSPVVAYEKIQSGFDEERRKKYEDQRGRICGYVFVMRNIRSMVEFLSSFYFF